jgi:hypothetical protein
LDSCLNVDGPVLVDSVRVIGHVNGDAVRHNKIAIAAIAAAVDLRVCARAHERRKHHLKNFSFHDFFLSFGSPEKLKAGLNIIRSCKYSGIRRQASFPVFLPCAGCQTK